MTSRRQMLAKANPHPQRKEIARYLLERGLDGQTMAPSATHLELAATSTPRRVEFPASLAPVMVPIPADHDPAAPLPAADIVVVTWTVDELAGMAKVFCPGHSASRWAKYTHDFDKYAGRIRSHAPAANSKRLGSYQPVTIGNLKVLCMKSELHLNQDGVKTGEGTATLPVKDFFKQIIAEANPSHIFTIGTSGSVFDDFQLGDVVVTRAAKFRLQQEFRKEPFNGTTYTSDWQIPTTHLDKAEQLMAKFGTQLVEPPFAPPTKHFPFLGPLLESTPSNTPDIKLEQGGRDMPEFHPILTTDYFEYGTSANRLDKEGAAVEMGDAALGLACSELADPPKWAVVRNMSDPVINGDLPAKQFRLNEQTTWAVGYYTAYGEWTSVMGAIATWGIIAGLTN
jgi:nucleoside phosphorylase